MSTVSSTVVHVDALKCIPQILLHVDCEPVHAVACHPKQPAVAMGNQSGVLKVWDYNNKVIKCSRVFETEKQIQCVTFDPQGEPICLFNKQVLLHRTSVTQLLHGFAMCHYMLQYKEPPFCL